MSSFKSPVISVEPLNKPIRKLFPLVDDPKVPSTSTALNPAAVFEFVKPETAFDAPNDSLPDTLELLKSILSSEDAGPGASDFNISLNLSTTVPTLVEVVKSVKSPSL